MDEKRRSGQAVKNRKGVLQWLVLTESKGKEGVGFKHKCGTEIKGAEVAHPIHDGPFALSGGGQVHYETVPFCPKCETEPNYHGAPIDHDPVERREIEILRRIAEK
ncbi:hypothetical protein LCGC14_1115570 [marine sediment metagenome]|uniref:Uncharacterized protein n=1 Tax=marine sediment metagenome TaxID=412755 RepID=A0A0F9MTE3_9ZZZZ